MRLLASVGPATSALESLASSIGAGLVVGGFVGGLVSLLFGGQRSVSEKEAVKGSYPGGGFGLLLLILDIVEKAFV